MDGFQAAKRRQRATRRHVALLLAVGGGSLALMSALQAVADEAIQEPSVFPAHLVETLDDEVLAGIRGKFVAGGAEIEDAVILWDERPGGSGRGGSGASGQGSNSTQGIRNHQTTRVATHRSQ